MFSEIQDDSGFIPVGFIKIELMPETERLNFIYREASVEGEGWAFSWGLNENHIEVCEVSEGPDGEDCYSHRDSIDWGDDSDYPDPDRLSRISFIASTWIKENAAEFLEGENGKGI